MVTGGAVRIGRAVVEQLQQAGVDVVVHCRDSIEQARALSPWTVRGDLADPAVGARLVEQAGPLDILINNASVFHKEALIDATPERVRETFQVNLFAPMALLQAFAAQAPRGGCAINVLDRRVRSNDSTCVPYTLSKQALEHLTRMAALAFAPRVRVSAVAPGPVLPPPGSAASVRELAGPVPLEATPTPGQVAEAVLFLLRAESITGQTLFVDGGQHLLGNGV